jgi:hypothetical protein
MKELVKVDMAQYGLEESKAAEVKKDFDAVLKIAVELEDSFNEVVAKPIEPQTCAEAKALRLKYVKVRTAIAAVHKERKAFYLSGGRAIDGLKNAYTHAVEGNEARLESIENHFANIERERIESLQIERAERCATFEVDGAMMGLGQMPEDVWKNYIAGVELQYNARKEAEAKAEAERIAREKAEAEERERIRLENIRLKEEAEAREKDAKIEAEKRAAEEKARLAKEQAERDRIEAERRKEREEAEKKLAAERAERERIEREQAAKEAAERERIEAERRKEREEAEKKLAAERAERERIEREQATKEAAERKAQAEAKARLKDTEHKRQVNQEVVASLMAVGLIEGVAKQVVVAIASKKIANVTINY